MNYGDLLEGALLILQGSILSFTVPIHKLFDIAQFPEVITRGKLTKADISVIMLINIPNVCFVYVVLN